MTPQEMEDQAIRLQDKLRGVEDAFYNLARSFDNVQTSLIRISDAVEGAVRECVPMLDRYRVVSEVQDDLKDILK